MTKHRYQSFHVLRLFTIYLIFQLLRKNTERCIYKKRVQFQEKLANVAIFVLYSQIRVILQSFCFSLHRYQYFFNNKRSGPFYEFTEFRF